LVKWKARQRFFGGQNQNPVWLSTALQKAKSMTGLDLKRITIMHKFVPIRPGILIASLLAALVTTWPARAAVLHVPNQFASIQAAVDAASSGDTIRITAGIYEEQVLIVGKNLRLSGAPGAVLKANPALLPTLSPYGNTEGVRPVLAIVLSDEVWVTGLTVDGARRGEINSELIGVVFHGSSGGIENCTVKNFRDDSDLLGSADGVAAGNFAFLNRPLQHVRISHCRFENNESAVVLTGHDANIPNVLRLEFTVQDNVINGIGPTDTGTQVGILINPGAGGVVKDNRIAGHSSTGAPYSFSFGIQAQSSQPVRYEGNWFADNQEHLDSFSGHGSHFINNTFQGSSTGTRPVGLGVSGDNLQIVNNEFSDMPTGITLFGDDPDFGTALGIATDVKLIANRFCHVAEPMIVEPLVTGVSEHGTRIGCGRNEPDHGKTEHDYQSTSNDNTH
jgi:hypothetical protein